MKFLILALCVCAANAAAPVYANLGGYKPWQSGVQPPVPVVSPVPKPVQAKAVYSSVDAEAAVVRSESVVDPDGFSYNYETSNGISAQSSGALKKVKDEEVLSVQGSFQYPNNDGTLVQFTYTADENGYQPQSDFLPVGPPVPEAIQRAVEYVLSHPPKEEPKTKY